MLSLASQSHLHATSLFFSSKCISHTTKAESQAGYMLRYCPSHPVLLGEDRVCMNVEREKKQRLQLLRSLGA